MCPDRDFGGLVTPTMSTERPIPLPSVDELVPALLAHASQSAELIQYLVFLRDTLNYHALITHNNNFSNK